MTRNQLHGIAARHGFQIAVDDEGNPKLRPVRDGARLPDRVLWLFKAHRFLFVESKAPEQGEKEFDTCTVCKALVNLEHAPVFNPDMSMEMFGCWKRQTRSTPGCPYNPD